MSLKIKNLDESLGTKLKSIFHSDNGFVDVEDGIIMPKKYVELCEDICALPVKKDDVFLCSYPRTGSTWAQELVWLLGNNLNFEVARTTIQQARTPMLELSAILWEHHNDWLSETVGNSVDLVRNFQGRRFIKTHLAWNLLPKNFDVVKPKVIYTARNPKDLCVSYYHYCALVHQLSCTLEEFCELFLLDRVPIGPSWRHMLGFWRRRDQGNVLFLKYEDMKRDLPNVIRKCADFLEIDRELTDKDIDNLCDYLKFDKMQKNPAVNLEPILFKDKPLDDANRGLYEKVKFIRKGQIGDWKNYLTEDLSKRFDLWIAEKFNGTGLEFEYY